MMEFLILAGIYLWGALMLIPGIGAYRGTWRRWAARRQHYELGKHSYLGFTLFYAGLAIILTATASLTVVLGAPQVVSDAIVVGIAASGFLCAVSAAYLPRILLPPWFRRWIDDGAHPQDVLQARRGPYSLRPPSRVRK